MALLIFGTLVVGLFGAIIGSFLNVVIYRMPRDLSIGNPRWSMCPHCEMRIKPRDNVPIVGWLLLKGRCRNCGMSIASIYPIVESMTALAFLTIWDAFFVAQIWGGWSEPRTDWALLVALLVLAAVLIAISAMDVEAYTVDIRPLWFAMAAGIVAYTVWFALRGADLFPTFFSRAVDSETFASPDAESSIRNNHFTLLPPSLCVVGALMGAAWVLTEIVLSFFPRREEPEGVPSQLSEQEATPTERDTAAPFRPGPVFLLMVVLIAAVALPCAQVAEIGEFKSGLGWRGWLAGLVMMGAIVLASLEKRVADETIIEEIEAESDQARSMALAEFARLLPALALGVGLLIFMNRAKALNAPLVELPLLSSLNGAWLGAAGGALFSLASAVFGAALGWSVRIGGTLLFGKEAFGSGDIYILAAIGVCLGFWGAFFAMFLGVFLALLGVILTMFAKSARAIPFGPWLALGVLVYVWIGPDLIAHFQPAVSGLWQSTTAGGFTGM